MESFTYVDIFATKWIEYIFVIGVLLLFIPFWRYLTKPVKAVTEVAERIIPAISGWFRLPEDRFYHQGHSWAKPESSDVVTVGIDDFALKLMGKINTIKIPQPGTTIIQGEKAWQMNVNSKSIDMLSPVDGEVIDVNEELLNSPQKINENPYDKGWLIKVRIPNVSANLKNLLSGELAKKWMDQVQDNLLARMSNNNLGLVYQDGGLPVDGMAMNIDRENWDNIIEEFFLIP